MKLLTNLFQSRSKRGRFNNLSIFDIFVFVALWILILFMLAADLFGLTGLLSNIYGDDGFISQFLFMEVGILLYLLFSAYNLRRGNLKLTANAILILLMVIHILLAQLDPLYEIVIGMAGFIMVVMVFITPSVRQLGRFRIPNIRFWLVLAFVTIAPAILVEQFYAGDLGGGIGALTIRDYVFVAGIGLISWGGRLVIIMGAERLAKLLDSLTEFTGIFGHEIRVPLQVVKTNIDQILRITNKSNPTDADRERLVQLQLNIVRIVNNIATMIDQLMTQFRVNAGAFPYHARVVDAGGMIAGITSDHEEAFQSEGLTLTVNIAGDVAEFPLDEHMLQHLIPNGLSNARKYNRPGGSVTVNVYKKAADLCIDIADTGRGIPADKIDQIWEPFKQVQSGDSHKGTGLGMPLMKKLMEQAGGSISITSAVDVGTTLTFRFPAVPAPDMN